MLNVCAYRQWHILFLTPFQANVVTLHQFLLMLRILGYRDICYLYFFCVVYLHVLDN